MRIGPSRVRAVGMVMAFTALVVFGAACSAPSATRATPISSEPEVGTSVTTAAPAPTLPASAPGESAPASVAAPLAPALTASAPEATELPATPVAVGTLPSPATAIATPTLGPRLDAVRLSLSPVAQGLSAPLLVTHAGDGSGRLFIVEKTGAIRLVVAGQLLERPFLDIADRITSSGYEQGLLGLAFPPDYAARGFFFVNYTDKDGDTVVARFSVTSDPDLADPGSEFKVLGLDQPAANHNGGHIVFGPDGYLWIGIGDGGAANDRYGNGQNAGTLLGKMLRLDVTTDLSQPYMIPADNPWVEADWEGQNMRNEVWALGLRNPWRYSFDRSTGDLWIADVGQNQIEEVNTVRFDASGGLNFGWPVMEGAACFQQAGCDQAGLELPVVTYNHGGGDCSVTGGYVYRGEQYPALNGVYVYGDFCSGRIWGLDAANPGMPVLLLETRSSLSSFGEDEAGEIYVTDLGRGTVQQLVVE